MKALLTVIAAGFALGCASQALADEAAIAPAKPVATAGVNFRDPAAVRVFYERIRAAAHEVCDSNSANPRITQRDALCVDKAVSQAVRSADRPLLTALYSTSHEAQASR